MTLATYKLTVDWDGKGTFGGTAADVTARALSVEWSRGRDYASQLAGKSVAGRFSAVLNNESGDYSPFNTSSPISGSVLPGRSVRLLGTSNGTVGTLWTGFLETIIPQPSVKGLAVARLEAVGPMGYYSPKKINLGHQANVSTGSLFLTLCRQVATVGALWVSAIDVGQTTITRVWFDQTPFLDALQECEDTEAGFMQETKKGNIGFQGRHYRLSAAAQTSKATFSDAGTALTYVDLSEDDAVQSIFNHLETSVQLYGTGTLGTLWTLPIAGTGYQKLDKSGETLTIWAEYPVPDAPSDDIGVDSWTTPTAGVDYFANSQANGSGTDKSTSVTMTVSKYGNRMRMVLSNNDPTNDIWLTSLNARGVPVRQLDPITISRQDDISGTLYGTRDYPNPAKLVPTISEADSWARFNLGIFKNPQPVLAVSIIGNRDDSHMAQVFSRDISDRVTIIGTGPAGLGINEDFFIEAERHSIDARREHRVTWLLSQAKGFSDFWVLDYSKLGTTSRVAY